MNDKEASLLVGALFFGTLLIAGCVKDPVSVTKTNNPGIDLGLLFEHEGCKVYRFRDVGNYRYYADCRGHTEWQEEYDCGRDSKGNTKRCRREQQVETVE